jgi:hypothetical protein
LIIHESNDVVCCRENASLSPMTRQSPKTPKGKNVLVGEASSLTVVEELEPMLKVEPVIQMSQKKPPTPPPLYRDTDSNTASKVPLPT